MGFLKRLFSSNSAEETTNSIKRQKSLRKSVDRNALKIMYETRGMYGDEKHSINRDVIQRFSNSNAPLDILAVALAYAGEGAKYRLESIDFFERFLAQPADIPRDPNAWVSLEENAPYFSYRDIYTTLGKFYTAELMFDKAIDCYHHVIQIDNGKEYVGYTLIGDVYTKIDINQCVAYYEELKRNTRLWTKDKDLFESKYTKALELQKNGYIYKPRKKTKEAPTFDLAH